MGDFNQIAHPSEKLGGKNTILVKVLTFTNFWQNNSLLDYGAISFHFTWSDMCEKKPIILQTLNDALRS